MGGGGYLTYKTKICNIKKKKKKKIFFFFFHQKVRLEKWGSSYIRVSTVYTTVFTTVLFDTVVLKELYKCSRCKSLRSSFTEHCTFLHYI